MLVRKNKGIEVELDLTDFLEGRFDAPVSSRLLERDLDLARSYYSIFSEMKRDAKDLALAFCVSPVENCFGEECLFVDSAGVAQGRSVDFLEINKFVDYLKGEYYGDCC